MFVRVGRVGTCVLQHSVGEHESVLIAKVIWDDFASYLYKKTIVRFHVINNGVEKQLEKKVSTLI